MKRFNAIKSKMLLALFAIASTWAVAQTQSPIEIYQLSNGLTVILQEDHRRPEVMGFISTRAGSVNEDPTATGLAHYLEHMLFKGTTQLGTTDWDKEKPHYDKIIELYDQLGKTKDKKQREAIQKQINEESIAAAKYVVPNELSRLVGQMGGVGLNAFTSYDITAYFSMIPSSQLERWLALYSHIFQQPVFRSFQAELETVYEEYNMNYDSPDRWIQETIMKNLFKKTPYSRSVLGLPEHLKNPSLTQLQKFFKTYYVPGNMSLTLVGDFHTPTAKTQIEQTFGQWTPAPVPTTNFEEEAPFKGREFLELKMGPTDAIILGFRTAPIRSDDDVILDVCGALLSNGQSGLIDQLVYDNKILYAGAGNNAMKYGGVFMFETIPNPQEFYEGPSTDNITTMEEYRNVMREMERARIKSLPKTEEMILDEIEALKEGEFGDWQLESAKQALITGYQRLQESTSGRAQTLGLYFANGQDLSQYINYEENIRKITKDDVLRIAKKYFGKDYLTVFIKPGSIKKNEIDKPEYKPLEFPQADVKSTFAKTFDNIQTPEQKYNYINLDTDVQKIAMTNGNTLYYSKNPVNDIFSLIIRYEVGQSTIKELEYAGLLNYAGAAARDAKGLKGQFARLNCSYGISASKNYVTVSLSGPEQNLRQALTFLDLFINQTNLQKNQMSRLAQSERYGRQQEREEPEIIANALEEYVLYGNKSDYLDRLSIKDLMGVKANELVTAFKLATEYKATIFYSGARPANEIKTSLEATIHFAKEPKEGKGYQEREKQTITDNTVYFINHSSLQAQIGLFANGKPFQLTDMPKISAFNNYFGGGMNALMFQEIREFRSLAYGSGAAYQTPGLPGKPAWFTGVIQTQADKANTALDVFMGLINDMPQKPERMDGLKAYLELASSFRPDFRSLPQTVENWQRIGYTDDPLKTLLPAYKTLQFDDIVKFNNEFIKTQPKALMLVGPKKRIDTKALSKYGVLRELKLNDVFSKDDE
ncbi:MAG: insulinase family protein [Prevotellaceae bacterium]|jgi:predicted Zn-dependent peptidase|nr:insulinase family protein [Prevotellaceae bacterium]